MQIAWRALFDGLGVAWRDRGSNTSAGNVNICCPFCVDDHGFHLSVSEDLPVYYCYRRPNQHSGGRLIHLLVALGVARNSAVRLLNEHMTKTNNREPETTVKHGKDLGAKWLTFTGAEQGVGCSSYLESRGFEDPAWVAQYYDLRYSPVGGWAMRLLLPLKYDHKVVAWTGRALRSDINPRYLSQEPNETTTPMLYVPDAGPLARHGATCVVVEGPLDALKVAVSTDNNLGAIALTGKSMNSSKILMLKSLLANCAKVVIALDADAVITESLELMRTLRSAGVAARMQRSPPPAPYKDAGEMSSVAIRTWLGVG